MILRVALSIAGAYIASERTWPHPCHFEEARTGWASLPEQHKTGLAFKLLGIWERWDACWYVKIATYGYRPEGDGGFFPFVPFLLSVVGTLLGGSFVLAGLVVSAVALVLALWGVHRLVAPTSSDRVARRAMAYLTIFPGALFLLAPFSEAVFLALAAWTLDAARRGSWMLAGLLALLAGLTRPVGILMAVPLAWLAYRAWRDRGGRLPEALSVVTVAAPAIGFGAFAAFASYATAESPLEQAGRMGSSSFHPPWEVAAASLRWTVERGDPLQAVNLGLLALFVGLVALGARRLPMDLTLYAASLLAVLATRINPIPLSGTTRYLSVVFPALVVLALFAERPRLHWAWVVISLLLLGLLTHAFVRGDFVA